MLKNTPEIPAPLSEPPTQIADFIPSSDTLMLDQSDHEISESYEIDQEKLDREVAAIVEHRRSVLKGKSKIGESSSVVAPSLLKKRTFRYQLRDTFDDDVAEPDVEISPPI